MAAGGHRADVDAGVGGVLGHPDPVAEQRAAGERRGRVDGEHADPLARLAVRGRPAPRWTSTCRRPASRSARPRTRCPASGASAAITSRSCGDAPSTREISRATARGRPSRACATSVETSCITAPFDPFRSRTAERRRDAATQALRHAHDQRVALPAAAAQRGRADAAAAPLELQRQVQHEPGAGHADRVAERDRAAVDVHLFRGHAEVLHRLHARPPRTPR